MKVLIASVVTGLIVGPIVTVGTCYYFKNDILKFMMKYYQDFLEIQLELVGHLVELREYYH